MSRNVRSTWGVALALAAVLAGVTTGTAVPPSATAAGAFCETRSGLTPNLWQGAGVVAGADDQWEEPANWSLGMVPRAVDDPYVCIPSGGRPVLRAGEESQLVLIDVDTTADVLLAEGSKLFLFGDQLTQSSTIRGSLTVSAATLGGPARTEVLGTLTVTSLPTGAASVTTRECAIFPPPYRDDEEPCVAGQPITGAKGLLEVADDGVIDIDGRGINLRDEFQVVVRGLMRIRGEGYVAADHGTRLELRPHLTSAPGTGTLRFENDGDWVEGFNEYGTPALGAIVNEGLVTKTGGDGISLVSATYSQPSPGRVSVSSGTLLLPQGSGTPAKVAAGVSYGSGRCARPSVPDCTASTFNADRQNARLTVPQVDSDGTPVTVNELAATSSPADIGFPVEVHASALDATTAKPAVIVLRYDERLLGGRSWGDVKVFRKPTGGGGYAEVPACLTSGRPPVGAQACVDRRGLPGSSRDVVDARGADRGAGRGHGRAHRRYVAVGGSLTVGPPNATTLLLPRHQVPEK